MTIADLQKHLGDLAVFLESAKAGVTVVNDLKAVRDSLTPFAGKSVKEFAGFLVRADEFDRTGKLEPPAPNRTRVNTRTGAATASPAELAVETKNLYDRAASPSVTIADIEALAAKLAKLQKAGLVTVSEALGLRGMASKTKDKILTEIRRMIEDRKGSHQRAEMINASGGGLPATKPEMSDTAVPSA